MTHPAPGPHGRGGGRGGRWRAVRARALGLAAVAGAALAQGAAGQDRTPPGVRLSFDLSQRLEADSNLALDPDPDGTTVQAVTDLGFGLLTRTPISSLELDADATLRLADGPDVDERATFDGPVLSFGYERRVPSSGLTLNGQYRQDDVAFLRDLTEFVNEDGVLELPDDFDDFDDFEEEGTRRSLSLDAALSLRDDRPFGVVLRAGVFAVDYVDVTSAELVDSLRTNVGADLRFTLTEAAELTLGFTRSGFEEDGEAERVSYVLDADASIDRPRGPVSASLTLVDTEEGLRTGLSFGRSLSLPTGSLAGSLGIVRAATGDLDLTGTLDFRRDLPRGAVSVSFAQAVRQGDDDAEELVTTLAAGYRRDLTPLASLDLDAVYGASRETETDALDQSLSVGATLGYQLTRDWGLSVGYRHRLRDADDEDPANGDSVFLTIGRRFEGGL